MFAECNSRRRHPTREVYYKLRGRSGMLLRADQLLMHEMSGEEEDNACFYEEEFNRWLSDVP